MSTQKAIKDQIAARETTVASAGAQILSFHHADNGALASLVVRHLLA
jgi:hypothetical protein